MIRDSSWLVDQRDAATAEKNRNEEPMYPAAPFVGLLPRMWTKGRRSPLLRCLPRIPACSSKTCAASHRFSLRSEYGRRFQLFPVSAHSIQAIWRELPAVSRRKAPLCMPRRGRAHGLPRSRIDGSGTQAAFATVLAVCAATAIIVCPQLLKSDAFEETFSQLLDVAAQHLLRPVWYATFRGGAPQHASPEPQRTSRWQSPARRGNSI
jgi:hypothetical protein